MGWFKLGRPIIFAESHTVDRMRFMSIYSVRRLILPLSIAALPFLSCASAAAVEAPLPTRSSASVHLDASEYDLMLEMSPEEARARYGETVDGYLCRDCEFTLARPISRFREELLTRFSPEEIARGDIRIKEMTWKVDALRNLTIWYRQGGTGHRPVHQMVWNRTWQFDEIPSS